MWRLLIVFQYLLFYLRQKCAFHTVLGCLTNASGSMISVLLLSMDALFLVIYISLIILITLLMSSSCLSYLCIVNVFSLLQPLDLCWYCLVKIVKLDIWDSIVWAALAPGNTNCLQCSCKSPQPVKGKKATPNSWASELLKSRMVYHSPTTVFVH